jgi:protein gp37
MTKIEWTWVPDGKGGFKKGETTNPQVGCVEKSPACRHCYAASTAHLHAKSIVQHRGLTVKRTNGVHWNGEINRVPKILGKPLHWREPRGIFLGSMTDTFLRVDTEEDMQWIAAIYGVAASTLQHTTLLLTKRPKNAERFYAWLGDDQLSKIYVAAQKLLSDDDVRLLRMGSTWPLPNLWLGVTAEDQQRADENLDVLVRLPAAVRYTSYEPACGPVDLSRWIERIDHCNHCMAEFEPQVDDRCPECGREGTLISTWGEVQAERYRNGERQADRQDGDDGPQLHWVIAGGESGHGARPPHPDWFRSVRDQCTQAGVSFFFKQWGEWAPAGDDWTHVVFPDGKVNTLEEARAETAVEDRGMLEATIADCDGALIRKLGKAIAGRELDGKTWSEFPCS